MDADDYDPHGIFYCEDSGAVVTGVKVSITGPLGRNDTVGEALNGIRLVKDGTDGQYQFYSEGLEGVFTLNIEELPGDAILSLDHLPEIGALDVTTSEQYEINLAGSATSLGDGITSLGSGIYGQEGRLTSYERSSNPKYWLQYNIETGDPDVINNNIPLTNCTEPSAVVATKTANTATAKVGDVIAYTLTFETDGSGGPVRFAQVIDQLPNGLGYIAGTAKLDDVAVEPTLSDGKMTWSDVTVLAQGDVTISYQARVTAEAPTGNLVNQTWMTDQHGEKLSNVATAVVSRVADAMFDCSDVVGKVFMDLNRNGIQEQGETGISNARILALDGTVVTTDQSGRYNLPCAALPNQRGSNLTLKLDTQSLEDGIAPVSRNPVVTRVTAGKVAKINFAVAPHQVVVLRLSQAAFDPETGKMTQELANSFPTLVQHLKLKPSILRIEFLATNGQKSDLRNKMRGISAEIRRLYGVNTGSLLHIEQELVDRIE